MSTNINKHNMETRNHGRIVRPGASDLLLPRLRGSAAKGLTMDDLKLQRVCKDEDPTRKAKSHHVRRSQHLAAMETRLATEAARSRPQRTREVLEGTHTSSW